jgi:type I restriction enzyme S subunit
MKRQPSFRSGANINRFRADTDFQWPLIKMGDVVTLHYGKALTERARRTGHVPVYGTNGRTGWHDTALGQGPTVILGRKGMGNLGVEWCPGPFWVIDTGYYTSFREDVLPHFFYYFTNYVGLNHLKDGTSNPSLSRDTFAQQLFPLPPINEQQSIASLLSMLDDKIELNRRMNDTLQTMTRAIFKSWFVDFDPVRAKAEGREPYGMNAKTAALFPSSFENSPLGKIPKGWQVRSIGQFFVDVIGGDWGAEVASEDYPVKVAIIRGTDFAKLRNCEDASVPRRFVKSRRFESRQLKPGDLILEISGGSPGQPTGRSILFTHGLRERLGEAVPASFCRLIRSLTKSVSYFLALYLADLYDRGGTWLYQNQSTGISNFQFQYFSNSEILTFPSDHTIIDLFAREVGPLFEKIDRNQLENCVLIAMRDTLLPKLISGEIRVLSSDVSEAATS